MIFETIKDQNSGGFGYVFDVDFTDTIQKYFTDVSDLTEELFQPMAGKLTQDNLRQTISLYKLQDTSYYSFFKDNITTGLISDMVNYNEETTKKFNILYPYMNFPSVQEFLNSFVSIGGMICFDKKGFHLNKHVDNRFIMGSFVINVQDNEDVTKFHVSKDNDYCYHVGPKEFGKGVFFFNTEETHHSILVENQTVRKSLIFNVMINY